MRSMKKTLTNYMDCLCLFSIRRHKSRIEPRQEMLKIDIYALFIFHFLFV